MSARSWLIGAAAALSIALLWRAQRPRAEHAVPVTAASEPDRADPPAAPAAIAEAAQLPVSVAPAPPAAAPLPEDEAALMNDLRSLKDSEPEFAIQRAREGNQRFPNSSDAPERSSILIHALGATGHAAEARGEAEDMVNRYPDSGWVREIEQFTGAHRHRNLHLNADGQLASDD